MARGRGPALIVISLLLAALAAWIANRWIVSRSNPGVAQAPAMVPALSAAMSLPIGTTIENRHVAIVQMLQSQAPAGSFHDVKQLLGKVTSTNVQAGQLLLASMFGNPGETSLAASVKKDMRAITVRVNDVIGVAGFLLPGSHADQSPALFAQRNIRVRRAAMDPQKRTATNDLIHRYQPLNVLS